MLSKIDKLITLKKIGMILINFIHNFPNEQSCRQKFNEFMDLEGIEYRKCGSTSHYWYPTIEQIQNKFCKTRTLLRMGTIIQTSMLLFRNWVIVMHSIIGTRKTFSALELQEKLGQKFYEPVWYILQKLRTTWKTWRTNINLTTLLKWSKGFSPMLIQEKR